MAFKMAFKIVKIFQKPLDNKSGFLYTTKANKQKLPLLALAAGAAGLIKLLLLRVFILAELVLPLFSFLYMGG